LGDEFLFTDQDTSTVIMQTFIVKRRVEADNTFTYNTVEVSGRKVMRTPARLGGSAKLLFNDDPDNLDTADTILGLILAEMVTQGIITGFVKPAGALTAEPRNLSFGGQTFDVVIEEILKKSGKFGWFIDSTAGQVFTIVDLTTGLPTKTIRFGDGTPNASTPTDPKFNAEPGWSSCEDASNTYRKYTMEGAGEFERIQETIDTFIDTKLVPIFDPSPPVGTQRLLGFDLDVNNLITSRFIDPVTEEVLEGYFAFIIDVKVGAGIPFAFLTVPEFTCDNPDNVGGKKFLKFEWDFVGVIGTVAFIVRDLEYTLFKAPISITHDTGDAKADGELVEVNEDMWKYSAPFVPFTKDFTVDILPTLVNKAISRPIDRPAKHSIHAKEFPFEYDLMDNVTNAGQDGFTGRFIRGMSWNFNTKSLVLDFGLRPESDLRLRQKQTKKVEPISETGYVGRIGQNDGFASLESSSTKRAFSGKGGSNGTGRGGVTFPKI